ncbi:efflux RND transporter periplasmic adaptor subunit [Gulosibacter sediminis]|uniref:efflux RND transporter periplasmic adaptor subunit n=1 Tax=Gulosibacter sediminis TaxID=1729695 RepID=UPI0024AD574D|nr:efflux RND transporter periplasmic adaptor subunit [Gulosibacter sediminis]
MPNSPAPAGSDDPFEPLTNAEHPEAVDGFYDSVEAEASGASAPTKSSKPAKQPKARRPKGRARKAIFGTVWLIVGVVAAASLAKLAFFSNDTAEQAEPTGQLESPTVEVTRGSVTNEFVVSGSVTADAGVPQRSTEQGSVTIVYVKVGDHVEYGQPLYELREEVGQTDPQPVGDPDEETGEQEMSNPEPVYEYHTVTATETGMLTEFTPLAKMDVAIGETIGEVGPGTFTVVADLSADLQYRMLDAPATASVAIAGGPAPFECTSLEIGAAADDSETPSAAADPDADPYADLYGDASGGSTSVTGQVRCAVPDSETVFAGLSADVTVVADSVDDALLVPTTAVRGDYATGLVYVVDAPGGEPQEVAVELGITDGMSVEITSGLEEGAIVLEYVPSEVPMYSDDMSGIY